MVNIYDTEMQFSLLPFSSINDLNLESTLKNLSLYDVQVDVNQPGIIVTRKLEENPLIPGVILTQDGQFSGMISRRRSLEHLSRPYGRELFLQRSIRSLQRFAKIEFLILFLPLNPPEKAPD
ncbi:hypothetical protein [Planktothrix agardhii]|uniref:Two-component sensor histidine kinase n=1 Tax=Planktothrix agardhii TaxID=1160 RepID=A0AAD1Q5R3_PLAAG|nr:Two-component sensor histidine kinase [Planktothrix agardhii]